MHRPHAPPVVLVTNGTSILCVLREMFLGVAIRAKQHALGNLMFDRGMAAVRQRTKIKVKALDPRVNVMPCQCGTVAVVTTTATSVVESRQQCLLAPDSARGLGNVALMAMIGVGVLALA
jgi:hypothetical protein